MNVSSLETQSQSWFNKLQYGLIRYWQPILLSLAVLAVVLLPLNLLSSQRFHHDEALYATWALRIISGDDPWLVDTAIDKPPIFLYTLAGAMWLLGITETAARTPSLLASAFIVLLTFGLGRKLYNPGVGILAAWLVALSPFMLLFAPTAFTDPLLVLLVLGSCLAAAYHQAGWAGFGLALAIATKQQGIFFLPLILGLLILSPEKSAGLPPTGQTPPKPRQNVSLVVDMLHFGLALLITMLPFIFWDLNRAQPSAFFEQSLSNYGGLTTDLTGSGERWSGFLNLLGFATDAPLLNLIFLVGCPLLLAYGLWQAILQGRTEQFITFQTPTYFSTDVLLIAFCLIFFLGHALLSFQIWDRYLLGLIPILAMLLARILLLPWQLLIQSKSDTARYKKLNLAAPVLGISLALLLILTLARPVQNAILARYPLGSNSQSYHGIEQITAYLQGQVGADNTLYHRWLGTHWRFYLWGNPYDLQHWDSPTELAAKAQAGHLIAIPTWRSDTELRLQLYDSNFGLHEVSRAYAPQGSPSIILYRIEPIETNAVGHK